MYLQESQNKHLYIFHAVRWWFIFLSSCFLPPASCFLPPVQGRRLTIFFCPTAFPGKFPIFLPSFTPPFPFQFLLPPSSFLLPPSSFPPSSFFLPPSSFLLLFLTLPSFSPSFLWCILSSFLPSPRQNDHHGLFSFFLLSKCIMFLFDGFSTFSSRLRPINMDEDTC